MTAVPNAESLGLIRCVVNSPFLGSLGKWIGALERDPPAATGYSVSGVPRAIVYHQQDTPGKCVKDWYEGRRLMSAAGQLISSRCLFNFQSYFFAGAAGTAFVVAFAGATSFFAFL